MPTTTNIHIEEALGQRVENAARRLGRTPDWVMRQAAELYVDEVERGAAAIHLPMPSPDQVTVSSVAGRNRMASVGEEGLFTAFARSIRPPTPLRAAITAAWHRPEPICMAELLPFARAPDVEHAGKVRELATRLVNGLRNTPVANGVAALVQEFSLSSQEGVALMCLAEALLRIPDNATRDALIRDKISGGDWRAHVGRSSSLFVNAAAWGLVLSGKLTATNSDKTLSSALARVIGKGGEPLIRQGVHVAMKLMGEQFVTGQNIVEALANSRKLEKQGFRYSYDMLGEAATTDADARRYLAAYEQAIHAIGAASNGRGIFEGPGISIKLSALHPRYSRAQQERVMSELLPRLLHLAELAKRHDIGMNIDAEEADRLEISLDLLEALCAAPSLGGWSGIGFVVQAYQKRCPQVIDHLIDLARRNRRRLMVRLVKGAYWDSEIKRAQIEGLAGYPVFTRKVHTDVSYLACARKLLEAPDAVYPQFATHNAQTLASIHHLAQAVGGSYYSGQFEFQCLHGMGEPLYAQVTGVAADGKLARPCRIYAPVGNHETLLAYLVRRLLENGANTSFVNRIGDASIPVSDLVVDPVDETLAIAEIEGGVGAPHPRIPLPVHLYTDQNELSRINSRGLNFANEEQLAALAAALLQSVNQQYLAAPPNVAPAVAPQSTEGWKALPNPADLKDTVGWVRDATRVDIDAAADCAAHAAPIWAGTPASSRAKVLMRAADLLEQRGQALMGLIVREAGKTFPNAVGEIREAADFLRYYGAQAAAQFDNVGERPLGVVLAISPWNFPLAIFTGQVAAALAAGNAVLAKPAEQTPLTAAAMVAIFHEAGIPAGALQLLPGQGETVGAALVAHPLVAGVLFTGSTDVARQIARQLAGRLSPVGQTIPLIAETGGQNAMVVDSSALAEQVTMDVLASAFDSAGQRCSALRVLCLQEDIAERQLTMLKDALQEWTLGVPDQLSTDVGPVIDVAARMQIETHIQDMANAGQKVTRLELDADEVKTARSGHFVAPAIIEIDSISRLKREVFGPVLHVMRFKREELAALVEAINASGYGLTFGVHSRIDETIEQLSSSVRAGNIYVNRNVIGAVVGVQPFGGMGLSGTGPKAGGPLYLHRLVKHAPNAALKSMPGAVPARELVSLQLLERLRYAVLADVDAGCARTIIEATLGETRVGSSWLLTGPTGESNCYRLLPRGPVLALPRTSLGLVAQVAASLASGNPCHVVLPKGDRTCDATWDSLVAVLGEAGAQWLFLADSAECADANAMLSAVLFEGEGDAMLDMSTRLAARPGAIVRMESRSSGELQAGMGYDLAALLHEQSISTNTAAAGGNAQLMVMN